MLLCTSKLTQYYNIIHQCPSTTHHAHRPHHHIITTIISLKRPHFIPDLPGRRVRYDPRPEARLGYHLCYRRRGRLVLLRATTGQMLVPAPVLVGSGRQAQTQDDRSRVGKETRQPGHRRQRGEVCVRAERV